MSGEVGHVRWEMSGWTCQVRLDMSGEEEQPRPQAAPPECCRMVLVRKGSLALELLPLSAVG